MAETLGLHEAVPFECAVWDASECAKYLRQSKSRFMQVTRFKEGFPPQTPQSVDGHPRWRAIDVVNWELGFPTDLHNRYTKPPQTIVFPST